MKNMILFILLFGMMNPVWSADYEKLVAKCKYDGEPQGDDDIITPGGVFIYILKIDENFFTVNGIAHKNDDLTKKNQPLRGELPLLKISNNNGDWSWNLPNFGNKEGNVRLPIPLDFKPIDGWRLTEDGDKFTMIVGSGQHRFTSNVYPICSLWKWWGY